MSKTEKNIDIDFVKQVAKFVDETRMYGEFIKWLENSGWIKERPCYTHYHLSHSALINIKVWFDLEDGMATKVGWYGVNGIGEFTNIDTPVKLDVLKKIMKSFIEDRVKKLTQYLQE